MLTSDKFKGFWNCRQKADGRHIALYICSLQSENEPRMSFVRRMALLVVCCDFVPARQQGRYLFGQACWKNSNL